MEEKMNITSAQYVTKPVFDDSTPKNVSIRAIIDGVHIGVPLDPANRHYQAILEWVAEGNTIQEAD